MHPGWRPLVPRAGDSYRRRFVSEWVHGTFAVDENKLCSGMGQPSPGGTWQSATFTPFSSSSRRFVVALGIDCIRTT